jgi:LysR family transcriptional regulator (chromosome initiation inhibitor)
MRYVCVATPAFAAHWFGDGFIPKRCSWRRPVVGQHDGALPRGTLQMREQFPHHTLPLETARRACVQDGCLRPDAAPGRPALATERLVDCAGPPVDVALSWHAWNLDTPFTKLLSEQIVKAGRDYLA